MTGTGSGAGRGKCVAAVTEAERCRRQVAAADGLVEIVTRFWSLRTITWHLGRDGTLAGRTGDGLPAAEARAVFGAWAAVLDLRPAIAAGPPGRPATHRAAEGRWAGVMVSLTANCSGRPGVVDTSPAPWRRPGGALRAAQALARIVTVGEQAGAAIGWRLSPDGDLTGTVHLPGSARRIRQVFRGWEQCLGLGAYEEHPVGDEIACRATAPGAVSGVPVRLVATLWPDWPPSRGAGRSPARSPAGGPSPPTLPPPLPGPEAAVRDPRP
jgi:hypothetical protein